MESRDSLVAIISLLHTALNITEQLPCPSVNASQSSLRDIMNETIQLHLTRHESEHELREQAVTVMTDALTPVQV